MKPKSQILLVGKRTGSASCSAQFLEKCNLAQASAGTIVEAQEQIRKNHFDFILAEPELSDGAGMSLKDSLLGSRASLYVSFPVRDGCWWLPVVCDGKDSLGKPALRPAEMVGVLMGSPTAVPAKRPVVLRPQANLRLAK